ncbi:MAG: hypothetical protein KDJ30_13090 [Rhodoblastus sp.]|nr:hypothetical protein [Rhodoblastus sp.]
MLVQLTRTSLLVIFQGRRATADDVQDVQNAIADYRTASDKLIATTLRLRVLTYQPPGPRSHEETQAWRTQNCGERWLAGLDQWLSSESKFPKKRGGRRQPSREDHLQRFLRFYEHAFGTRAAYPASGAQPHVDFVKSYFHTINDFLAHSDFEFEEDRTRVLAYWTVDDEHGTLHDRIIKAKYKGVMPIADSTVL